MYSLNNPIENGKTPLKTDWSVIDTGNETERSQLVSNGIYWVYGVKRSYNYVVVYNDNTIAKTNTLTDLSETDEKKITSVFIGPSITEIGNELFKNKESLSSVTFQSTSQLTTIGDEAFRGCKVLKKITIPKNVTTIKTGAFKGCVGLESVSFANGSQLTTIGSEAFSDCATLENMSIPASITSIGYDAFLVVDDAKLINNIIKNNDFLVKEEDVNSNYILYKTIDNDKNNFITSFVFDFSVWFWTGKSYHS